MRRRNRHTALGLLLAAGLALAAAPAAAATRRVAMGGGMAAALSDEQQIFLEAPPLKGEGFITFSRRLTGSSANARAVAAANGNPRRVLVGVRYKVPFALLTNELKLRVVGALFPGDEARPGGWIHHVGEDEPSRDLWHLSTWFTGAGGSFSVIREYNQLADEAVPPGTSIVIPPEVLLPVFRAQLPERRPPASSEYTYARDDKGEYLVYRLKRGEALYSNVVMRFNGSTFAVDVNALAREIATLNGIRDVTDMAVGQPVRVPFDLLLPEYLPPDDPRRREYEKDRKESAKYSNTVRTATLDGITVILDAGHGGEDPGAMPGNVWESIHVYDIMLRVKRILETRTAANVAPTTRAGNGFEIAERDKLSRARNHTVLTHPPYKIADSTVANHLRWYLANSVHRAATQRSGDPDKTIFISFHADSLHKSMRGAMAYIPAASLTRGEYGKTGTVYEKRREVKEKPRVSYSWTQRTKSEGLSRQLATHLLDSFRSHGLAIHPDKPIRDRVIRCRRCRPWVPAVVRRNAVPAKLLLEVCNLNNREDRRLLETRAFRQKVAEAVVDGIHAYYGESAAAPRVAASAR